ncbi:UNVERIFIED_CONTAM: hypothetical protein Slati_2255500 [Sesamum latifolium]|uniref:Uncharacterized protein n=1 Tax=Sesamum latifolium TaxID=2727402 RepID=A0AAW2WV63_9LAMI
MGDQNTKFFHNIMKRNAAKNSILVVTKGDGSIISSAADIAQEFIVFYTSLLGTEVQTLPIDDDVFEWALNSLLSMPLELCRAVTLSEVKQDVFHISNNNAPGPDGYSSCLFKKAWNIV